MSLSGLEDDPARPIRWQMLSVPLRRRDVSDNNWQQVITALSSGHDYGEEGATATEYREAHR